MRTAADWNALFLATLRLAFHTSTDGAVHRRPHLSILQEATWYSISWGGNRKLFQQCIIAQERMTFPVGIMSLFSLNYFEVSVHGQSD